MEIFIVEHNYPYEGSDIKGVFSSIKLAQKYVKSEYIKIIEDKDTYFDLGYDYITIEEFILDKEIK